MLIGCEIGLRNKRLFANVQSLVAVVAEAVDKVMQSLKYADLSSVDTNEKIQALAEKVLTQSQETPRQKDSARAAQQTGNVQPEVNPVVAAPVMRLPQPG